MKKTNLYFLVLVVLHLSACKTEERYRKQKETLITDGDSKIWDVVQEPTFYSKSTTVKFPFIFEYFNKDGRYYLGYFDKDSFFFCESDDIVIYHRWKLDTDSSINCDGAIYRIIKLTNDTLITETKSKKISVLARHRRDKAGDCFLRVAHYLK